MKRSRNSWGSVRKLPSGRIQARWKNDRGIYETAPTTFASITDARSFLAKVRSEIENGTWKIKDEGNQPFAPFAKRFLETVIPNIKETTANKYEQHLRIHVNPQFGSQPIKSIKSIDVSEWVTKMIESGARAGTVKGAHGVMRQVMTEAVRSGLIDGNPCSYTRFPRQERYEPKILTAEQVSAIMFEVPERYFAFVGVLAYCGLRFGEAAALRIGRVDLARCEISIVESVTNAGGKVIWGSPKTYECRTVSLPSFLTYSLAEHLNRFAGSSENDLVFTGDGGGWVQNNNFRSRIWKPTILKLMQQGVLQSYVLPKDLRATCGSWVAATDGVLEAAKRLGHSNTATTTKHYARPIAGRDLVVARHLDEQFASARRSPKSVA